MAASRRETEILTCSICLEILREPKILPCFHRFCKECLSELAQSKAKGKDTFHCPTCRQVIAIPDEGIRGFKGDFLIQEILEIRGHEANPKPRDKDQMEQICSSCDTTSNMVAFCSECEGLICKVCFFCHKTMKAMQGHTHVIPLKDTGSRNVSLDGFNDTITYCLIHPDVILEKYCRTCEEVVCVLCDSSNAHQCHHVTKISKSERLEDILQRFENYMSLTKQNLDQQLNDVYNLKLRVTINLTKVLSDIELIYNEAKQIIDREKKTSLQKLEIQRQEIEQRTHMNMQLLNEKRERATSEASTLQMFCGQQLVSLETEKRQYIDKLEETSHYEDCISSLLSAIEIRNDLQNHIASSTSTSSPLEAMKQVEICFTSLECSLLTNICWKREQPIHFTLTDKPQIVMSMSKIVCNGKEKVSLFISRDPFSRIVVLDVLNRENCAITADVWDLSLNLLSGYIVCKGSEDGMFLFVERNGAGFFSLDKRQPNNLVHSKLNLLITPSDNITCGVLSPSGEEILVCTSMSPTIFRCNRYDFKKVTSILIKDADCQPPVSLAVTKTCKEFIFFCDGKKKAMVIDQNGDVVCQFLGENDKMERPLKITVDHNQFVYVLWEVDDFSEGPYNEDGEGEFEEMIEGEYEGEYDIEYTYTSRKVVRQYSLSGKFVSEFDVYTDVTMMTTLQKDDKSDVLIVGSADGVLSLYTKTQFGNIWSNFIQKTGSKSNLDCLDQT